MKGLGAPLATQALVFADMAVEPILEEFKPTRDDGSLYSGGYFVLADADTGLPLAGKFIGDVPDDAKAEKYIKLAHEKAHRLARMRKTNGHILSWQSRDPGNGLWGGAVYIETQGGNYILSFSGLPEHWDEAAMLMVAHLLTETPIIHLYMVAKMSGNERFHELARHFGVNV